MIKAKPRKKNIVKVNETKEIKIIKKPSQEKLEATELAVALINIYLTTDNHKKVWDIELQEYDGIIPFKSYMEICKVRSQANKLFHTLETDYFDNNDIEDNFYYRQAFVNQVEKSITGVSKELYLTVADVNESLPAGFMGTIISWKNMIRGLSKFKKLIKTLELEKEIKKLVDASKRFFGFIDEEIKIDNIY